MDQIWLQTVFDTSALKDLMAPSLRISLLEALIWWPLGSNSKKGLKKKITWKCTNLTWTAVVLLRFFSWDNMTSSLLLHYFLLLCCILLSSYWTKYPHLPFIQVSPEDPLLQGPQMQTNWKIIVITRLWDFQCISDKLCESNLISFFWQRHLAY